MSNKDAINNLESISSTLEKMAGRPENYGTEWAYYLEQMSLSMHQHADDLRNLEYGFGVSPNVPIPKSY